MRTFLILFCALFVTVGAESQTAKGRKYISGSVDVTYHDFESAFGTSEGKSVSIRPAFGFFISEKTALGAEVYYTWSKDEARGSSWVVGVSPFVRRHREIVKRVYWFTELKGGVAFGKENTPRKGDISVYQGSIASGFLLLIGKRVGIEAEIGLLRYDHRVTDYGASKDTFTNFLFNTDLTDISLGLQVYF